MKVQFLDLEDKSDPAHGTAVKDQDQLLALLDRLRSREPFACELIGGNGSDLMIGVGPVGFAQHSRHDGIPPYLVTVAADLIRRAKMWSFSSVAASPLSGHKIVCHFTSSRRLQLIS